MKTKNLKVGDLVYVKKREEMRQSKYFLGEGLNIVFENGANFSLSLDGWSEGQVVEVVQITRYNIEYKKVDKVEGLKRGIVSRHAFRKPTKKELLKHKGELI